MFNELEIIKRLNECSGNLAEKASLLRDYQSLTNDEKADFLLIMNNLKETFIIRNVEISEDKDGKLNDYLLLEAPYLTGLGEKYLKSKN